MNTTLACLNLNHLEQKALELCGIVRLSQLATASPDQISRDLAAAERLFPNQQLRISPERLTDLCREARKAMAEANPGESSVPQESPTLEPNKPTKPRRPQTTEETEETTTHPSPSSPSQCTHAAGRESSEEFAQARFSHRRRRGEKGLDNYHAAHPIALVLASLFLLLTLLGALLLMVASAYLMIEEEPPLPVSGIIIFCALTGISYLLCLPRCRCVICRGRMCSVFSNKRGRHAHYVPLLGHTIPTAFAILFTLSTVCPHCNTRQSIIGGFRPSSRFHHHH